MYNDEEQLANLCDIRKAIISRLSLMGLSAQQIFDRLLLPHMEDVQQHIAAATQHYDTVANFMRQCEALGLAPDSDAVVYYFDWRAGVRKARVFDLVFYAMEYNGQKLVASADEIIPEILRPLMDEAVDARNVANISQLAEAMTYVIDELIPQEQPNG